MLQNMVQKYYPELSDSEARKFSLLGLIFFFIIGAYWLLRLLKNTIFYKIAFPAELGWAVDQGRIFQPNAKMYSVLVVFIMVIIYSRLIDKLRRHQLFYVICSFYAIAFALTSAVLLINDWYGPQAIGKLPLAITGWGSYFVIESFGSLVVALFWSFANSITSSDSAKIGFPIIIWMAQIGAVIGSAVMVLVPSIGTLWPILLAASGILVFVVIPLVRYFVKTTPQEQLMASKSDIKSEKKKEGFLSGFWSGFKLLLTRPYLFGIFIVATVYEVVSQIVEYQMQSQAVTVFITDKEFGQFQGIYGIAVNAMALLIALLGTSYILKRFGVRFVLLVYPVAFGIIVIGLLAFDLLTDATVSQLMWSTFAAMVAIKAVGYAVSNPTKEMMYIPTSKQAKFKTKGWIDTFGSRTAKFGGSRVTDAFKSSLPDLMLYGSIIGLILIAIWTYAAYLVGRKNKQLVEKGEIIS